MQEKGIDIEKSKNSYFTNFVKHCLIITCWQIDIESDIEKQGPFHVFLNKLSDVLAHASAGDKYVSMNLVIFFIVKLTILIFLPKSKDIISRIEEYIKNHPEVIIIDPLDNVRNLRDRYKSYKMIQNGLQSDSKY